ncbi:hypothetical protein [Oligosphaera ethanolica]|uniref:Uncharacterized protein n=1 Tax=Oligosphaera ethanolica TaxID=760260 RepID=A0AAE3VE05_9BACT|nr:hypothetical protein [Oligosphaera ethanolica]MDQ0288563.1 hypothetical protein [Oligosphaera ethanolica]NLE54147.1 hypothetical protein [Lentisphaerota bacterium]
MAAKMASILTKASIETALDFARKEAALAAGYSQSLTDYRGKALKKKTRE